jgi:hypothetical protein
MFRFFLGFRLSGGSGSLRLGQCDYLDEAVCQLDQGAFPLW